MNQPYKRPPITEAVIEIRSIEQIEDQLLAKAQKKFLAEYPVLQNYNTVDLRIDAMMQPAVDQQFIGYRLCTLDQIDIRIITKTSFSSARLAPYPGWDIFKNRAQDDWIKWKQITGMRQISRIGVRYINRIDIPINPNVEVKIDEYLKCYPELPDDSFLSLTNYAMQLVMPLEGDRQVVINTASVPSPLLNYASFILDFDVSREKNLPQKDEDIWALIDSIREQKNVIFEQCITDKTRALFNE